MNDNSNKSIQNVAGNKKKSGDILLLLSYIIISIIYSISDKERNFNHNHL